MIWAAVTQHYIYKVRILAVVLRTPFKEPFAHRVTDEPVWIQRGNLRPTCAYQRMEPNRRVRAHRGVPALEMLTVRNVSHTNHNQNRKAHRNGIKKPTSHRTRSLKGVRTEPWSSQP